MTLSTVRRQMACPALLLAVATLLAGCGALMPIQPGMTGQAVIAQRGSPTRTVPLTDAAGAVTGSRLQYSSQPMGQSALMVDLDTSGKVTASRQVLQSAEFARIQPGQWTRPIVEREFGPPAKVDRVASWQGDILNYRWRDPGGTDMLLWVYLDAANTVQRVGQGMELPIEVFEKD